MRVGTDAALALSMCNVLVNELGIYDGAYLQAKTNAPYLIGPDKLYVRDAQTNKPLVWDTAAKAARPFTDVKPPNMALEGDFEVNGVRCQPAFQKLKDHLKKFTPEWGERHQHRACGEHTPARARNSRAKRASAARSSWRASRCPIGRWPRSRSAARRAT